MMPARTLLVLLAWSLRRVARPDPVQRAWRAFCLKLAARGIERSPSEGPRDYACLLYTSDAADE